MNAQRILVIDDDRLVRESIKNVLKREGFDTVLTKDAYEALDRLKAEQFDLIISDIRMPGKNGVETIKEIRQLINEHGKKDIPIIFITGYAEMSDELDAEKLGEVILKPFDLTRLLMTIREYL